MKDTHKPLPQGKYLVSVLDTSDIEPIGTWYRIETNVFRPPLVDTYCRKTADTHCKYLLQTPISDTHCRDTLQTFIGDTHCIH